MEGYENVLFVMGQVPSHRHNVVLDIAQIQPDFASRRDFPSFVAALGEAFDDICLIAQEAIQPHDFLSAVTDSTQHITATFSRGGISKL